MAGDRACYNTAADFIGMPPFRDFTSPEAYYGTLAHESIHWTGAKARLGRDLTGRFGTASYAVEELVAEIGASFLCADLGTTPQARPEQVAYIGNWLKVLHKDSKAIFTAASMAGKALKGIVRPRYYAMPQQPGRPRAPVHGTFKRALSSTSPLQTPSPEQVRSAEGSQFREHSEPSKGNAIRHAGIIDRFQGEQAIKRWQPGEVDEIDRRARGHRAAPAEQGEERDQDQRDRDDLKAKHERLRDEARRELGIPDPETR